MSAIRDEYGAPFAGTVAGTVGANDKMVTGNWRSARPVLNRELCTQCLMCWISCPDACITPDEEAVVHNYEYCKGCGLCASVCPVGAVTMSPELDFIGKCEEGV
ncbi:MAG: 4Fe-4S binding protein [Bacillota bacterium]|jgi:2-oxoacid:acceptor oxidoreductase delta subunit (pyruvate/2-ketoisovalerate family)|nr:4Fe-4S binding protein [Bacillota bacterium]